MDKIHIRNMFRIFLPLADSLGAPQELVPLYTSGSFGVQFSTLKQLKIRLFCTDYFGNVKEEVKDCFSWAKRNPVVYQQGPENNVDGVYLRIKISQGVFDFRKTRQKLFRIIVELYDNGSVTRTGASTIMPLYPKKRQVARENEGNEITVPICWFGKDGYLIDNQSYLSPEDSPVSAQDSSVSVNTSNQLFIKGSTESNQSAEITIKFEDDAIFGESPTTSNEFLMVTNNVNYLAPNNENYMVLYNGNAEVVGNFRALNFYKASDINLKEDIRLLEEGTLLVVGDFLLLSHQTDRDCRGKLLQINGVEYKFKQGVSHATNKRFIGYIAQQIESVVPEAVQLIDGILHVDYESLIPYLSESIKQNYGDIQSVTSEVDRVKQALDALYAQFAGTKVPQKENAPPRRRDNSTSRNVFGWIAGVVAVSALLVFTIVFLFFTEPRPHKNRPTFEHLVPPAVTTPVSAEREMLLELYNYLRPQDSKPIWNFTESHCSWRGITCNSSTGRVSVIAIDLPKFASGVRKVVSLPASLGNFTDLQELDLSGNYIHSLFPEQIIRLTNLSSLKLHENFLFGVIPDLRALSKLKTLWLQSNQLQGPLDMLLQLPALESIIIQDNLMVGATLPEKISPSLVELELVNCGIRGTIPESWSASNLVRINLGQNMLNGSVPCFGPHVTILVANYNLLDGQFCGESLQAIKFLAINNNELTGPFDLPNVDVGNMTMLQINNNHFTSFMPSANDPLLSAGPSVCSAANNRLACPVPEWSVQRCQATCS